MWLQRLRYRLPFQPQLELIYQSEYECLALRHMPEPLVQQLSRPSWFHPLELEQQMNQGR
jgi:hypothetical protein